MQKYRVSFDLVLADESKLPNDWIGTAIWDNLDIDSGEEYYNLECVLVATDDVESESDKELMVYINKLVEAGVLTKSDRSLDSYYFWVNKKSYTLKHRDDIVIEFELHEGTLITKLASSGDDYVEIYDVLPKDLSIMQHYYVTVEELLN